MRVQFRVGVGVVHTVHDAVGPWAEVRRALCKPGEEKEKTLPAPAHAKGLVGCVAVLEKSLRKKGQVPMPDEKKNNK